MNNEDEIIIRYLYSDMVIGHPYSDMTLDEMYEQGAWDLPGDEKSLKPEEE